MAKILNHPRVYSFLHVPVQSASDNVLADMKREYCADDFRHVVDFLKDKLVVYPCILFKVVFSFVTSLNSQTSMHTEIFLILQTVENIFFL